MPNYFFFLGNTPTLSKAEIQSVLPHKKQGEIFNDLISLELDNDEEARLLMTILGGVVKILKLEKKIEAVSPETVSEAIADALLIVSSSKVKFALNVLSPLNFQLEASDIKKILRLKQIKSKYFDVKDRSGLSAAILLHQRDVQEISLFVKDDAIFLSRTIAIQNIDDWTKRDREKPYFDRKKGMLPPKVARILVNLGLGKFQENTRLYDPFCGTGTILMEAALRGCQLLGSDFDYQAVIGTKRNLDWLEKEYTLTENFKQSPPKVFQADVSKVSAANLEGKIDLIITEPFLGKPRPQEKQLAGIFKGLEKLYLGAFKQWTKLLKDNAKVLIIFPLVRSKNKVYSLKKLIDKLRIWGYTLEIEPLLYRRKQAIVEREILIFSYKSK
ncbi:MAG: hypothetical protein PVJ09_01080 [Candidatus Woesebacteria bacterium]|jgi:tRNA G10  N-methylase Trm11